MHTQIYYGIPCVFGIKPTKIVVMIYGQYLAHIYYYNTQHTCATNILKINMYIHVDT